LRVLVEPKNAIVKQFKKLFELDGVELEFDDDAVREIARKALARKTGARGLRSIVEELLLEVMYEIPSSPDVKRCLVTRDCVLGLEKPRLFKVDRKVDKKEETA